jgi:hypothetical protein
VLIVLASRHDLTARWLADEWACDGAAVLTCEDLSRAGWEHRVSAPRSGTASVGGRKVANADIRAVLTLLPSVTPEELPGIIESDREYVAQEVMAFLLAWLAALGPRAVNRPTPYCLMGPHWRRERWAKVAHDLGLPTAPMSRAAALGTLADASQVAVSTVAVVGAAAFAADGSPAHGLQGDAAIRLAQAAGAELLAVRFSAEGTVVDAHPWPDLRLTTVRAALRERLLRAGA